MQRPERRIDHVAKPITNRACAEGHPAAPIPMDPERSVRTERHRPDPEVVIQALGHVIVLVEFVQVAKLAVDIPEGITSRMNGVDLADSPGFHPLDKLADGPAGMPLVAE